MLIYVLTDMQAELYKEDFLQERKDREKAHNLKEELRLACDQTLHAKTIEMEQLQLASEETIQRLSKQVAGIADDRDQLKEIQDVHATRSTTKQHQLRTQVQQYQEDLTVTRKQLLEAQQEIQAKTAQVKQYKKKDDQREEKVTLVLYSICVLIDKPYAYIHNNDMLHSSIFSRKGTSN